LVRGDRFDFGTVPGQRLVESRPKVLRFDRRKRRQLETTRPMGKQWVFGRAFWACHAVYLERGGENAKPLPAWRICSISNTFAKAVRGRNETAQKARPGRKSARS